MNDTLVVKVYEKFRSKMKTVGLRLTIVELDDLSPKFAITTNKIGTQAKLYELINKHYSACTQDKCPVAIVSTLEEVSAVVMGFCIALGKPFPL